MATEIAIQAWDLQALAKQPLYSGYDKGLVGEGINNRCCSQFFLHRLLADFVQIRDTYLLADREADHHQLDVALEAILTECDRLKEHPELFIGEASKQNFFATAYRYAKQITDFVEAWEKLDEKLEVLFNYNGIARPSRPTCYDHDDLWGNYLNPGAPGSGIRVEVTEKDACLQIIPEPGLKLLNVWAKEWAYTAKKFEEGKVPKDPPEPALLPAPITVQPPIHTMGISSTYKLYGNTTNITPVAFHIPVRKTSRFPTKMAVKKESLPALNEALGRVNMKRRFEPHPNRLITALVTRWRGDGIVPPIKYASGLL